MVAPVPDRANIHGQFWNFIKLLQEFLSKDYPRKLIMPTNLREVFNNEILYLFKVDSVSHNLSRAVLVCIQLHVYRRKGFTASSRLNALCYTKCDDICEWMTLRTM